MSAIEQPGVEILPASHELQAHGKLLLNTAPAALGRAISLPAQDRVSAHALPRPVAARAIRVNDIWRETLLACGAYSSHLLPLIVAMAGIHLALAPLRLRPAVDLQMLAATSFEFVAMALAAAAASWIGLHGAGRAVISSRRLLRVVGARWPAVMITALIYGTLVPTIPAGFDKLLRSAVDGSGPGLAPQTLISFFSRLVSQQVLVESVHLLLPNSGLPFATPGEPVAASPSACDIVASAAPASSVIAAVCSNGVQLPDSFDRVEQFLPLLVALIADLLLRFRLATALSARSKLTRRPLFPMAESVRLALRHGPVVGMHVWLVRLCLACAGGLFVVMPVLLVQWRVMPGPLAGTFGEAWVSQVCGILTHVTAALFGALVMTFCAIYDARLFLRLRMEHDDM